MARGFETYLRRRILAVSPGVNLVVCDDRIIASNEAVDCQISVSYSMVCAGIRDAHRAGVPMADAVDRFAAVFVERLRGGREHA